MKLVDTHCHIHEREFYDAPTQAAVYERARAEDIGMVCVATSEAASREALAFCSSRDNTWAVLGVHPHEAKNGCAGIGALLEKHRSSVVGVGEIGLDYHYTNSPKAEQRRVLEQQLQWAMDYDLPVSFHVRSAFDDFWPIFDTFSGIRGVLHSFTDTQANVDQALSRGLYIGVNGISTFTKDAEQQRLYGDIPLENVVLETDAPFLTPAPFRGTMNEPKFVGRVAEHMAELHGVSLDFLSQKTTDNARRLFDI